MLPICTAVVSWFPVCCCFHCSDFSPRGQLLVAEIPKLPALSAVVLATPEINVCEKC